MCPFMVFRGATTPCGSGVRSVYTCYDVQGSISEHIFRFGPEFIGHGAAQFGKFVGGSGGEDPRPLIQRYCPTWDAFCEDSGSLEDCYCGCCKYSSFESLDCLGAGRENAGALVLTSVF